jgi:hypothetical protein
MLYFGLGGLVFFAGQAIERQIGADMMRRLGYVAIGALFAVPILRFLASDFTPYRGPQIDYLPVLGVADPLMVLVCCAALPFAAKLSAGWWWDRIAMGLVYPMLVGHMLIAYLTDHRIAAPAEIKGLIYIGLVLLFTITLYLLIERPLESYRRRFRGYSSASKPRSPTHDR